MLRLVLVLLAIGGLFPAAAEALWIAPQRPLTADEWLADDVSRADAIGIGSVVAVHDTIVAVASDGSGFPARSIRLHVTRWLKGSPGLATLWAAVSAFDDEPVRGVSLGEVAGGARRFVVMLRRLPEGWGVRDGPDPEGAGMRLLPEKGADNLVRRFERCIAAQSVDSVLAGADAVFVGHSVHSVPCSQNEKLRCVQVVVDSALVGVAAGDTISVFALFLGDIVSQRAVFMLRRLSSGDFERVGLQSGCQALSGERTVRWGVSLADIGARLRLLRAGGWTTKP